MHLAHEEPASDKHLLDELRMGQAGFFNGTEGTICNSRQIPPETKEGIFPLRAGRECHPEQRHRTSS